MIASFLHPGLKELFETGSTQKSTNGCMLVSPGD